MKNEVFHIEQARRSTFHRSAVKSMDNIAENDENVDANNTEGPKRTKVKRHLVRSEQSTIAAPLTHVLPERLIERTREKQSQRVQYRKRNDLKLAFSEFYLMLVLLQNYQTLNFTGFRKILKKHDKLFQTTRGEEWR